MAIFLQKAFRLPLKTGEPTSSFVDIPEGASYAEAVESILDAGITRGCSADPLLFCPNDTVNRDTMASFLARALRASDQLSALAYAPGRESLQTISIGRDLWNVWVCEDAPVREDIVTYLHREVNPYFRWLSGGRYDIRFQYGADPPRDVAQVLQNCRNREGLTGFPEGSNIFVGAAVGYGTGGLSWRGVGSEDQRYARGVWVDNSGIYDTTLYGHEIGHAFGWPHNHRDRSSPASEPLHTRMDIMASLGQVIGTNAHNLFHLGWIDPNKVMVHPGGTATYTIAPPHTGGEVELLMLPLGPDRLISVGARVKEGFDGNIREEGVELYDIELCGSYPGCKHVYLPPGARSNDPVVLDVRDSWTGRISTVRHGAEAIVEYEVAVQSRQNRIFEVRVKETSVLKETSAADGFSSIGVGRTGVCGLLTIGNVDCWDWRGGASIPTGCLCV
ncbi:MAG: hypothetical protein OXI56_08415 [bacterium]|nr:hypothetical protein [bacterium]